MTVSNAIAYRVQLLVLFYPVSLEVDLGLFFANQKECIQTAKQCRVFLHNDHIELYFSEDWKTKLSNNQKELYQFHNDYNHSNFNRLSTSSESPTITEIYSRLKQLYPDTEVFPCESFLYHLKKEI